MKINEIALGSRPASMLTIAKETLPFCEEIGNFVEDEIYTLHFVTIKLNHTTILTKDDEIAAYARFEIVNSTMLQVKIVEVYGKHKNQNLAGKLYKFAKNNSNNASILSDINQSFNGKKLWEVTLPAMGFVIKIYNTKTNKIIDESSLEHKTALEEIYVDPNIKNEKYCWIII